MINTIKQRLEELGLFVVDEEQKEPLLLQRISSEDIYRKQEGCFPVLRLEICVWAL